MEIYRQQQAALADIAFKQRLKIVRASMQRRSKVKAQLNSFKDVTNKVKG